MTDKLSLELTIEPLSEEQIKALVKVVVDAVTPAGGYEPGDGSMDGAQIVNGEWWHPVMGCDSLEISIDAIKERLQYAILLLHARSLRPAQAGKQEEAWLSPS